MNREYRLGYCQTCTKRGMNPKYGIVCSITTEPADFDSECKDYDQNESELKEFINKHRAQINILKAINGKRDILLSSNWTKTSFYTAIIVTLIPVLGLFIGGLINGFDSSLLIGIGVISFFGGIVILLYSRLCIANISNNKILIKRLFGSEVVYEFEAIHKISSFQLKTTRYVTCEILLENNSTKSYTIMNSRSLFTFEKKDAEGVLNAAKNFQLLKRFFTKEV